MNAATTSVSFTLLKTAAGAIANATPVTFDLSATSSLCTTVAGARTCSINFGAPLGDDIYSVQTFDANGNKLGSSAVNINVLQNVANTATISLGGTIASVLMTVLASFPTPEMFLSAAGANGDPTSARILVIGFDSQGNVILTPDTFSTPINLAFLNVGSLNLGGGGASAARHPLVLTTAPPVAVIQATVAYANPIAGVTSASMTDLSTPITVNSPNDSITITALAPGPQFAQTIGFIASVGPVPITNALPLSSLGPVSSVVFDVDAAPPGPTPVPTATPTPAAVLGWNANPPIGLVGGDGGSPTYTFASAQSPAVNLSVFESRGGTGITGSITISSTDCLATAFDQPASFPLTIAANGPIFTLETLAHDGSLPPAPAPPSPSPTPFPVTGVTCHITATDQTSLATSTLTVFINNASGLTVQ